MMVGAVIATEVCKPLKIRFNSPFGPTNGDYIVLGGCIVGGIIGLTIGHKIKKQCYIQ
jgi:hypothetical protein